MSAELYKIYPVYTDGILGVKTGKSVIRRVYQAWRNSSINPSIPKSIKNRYDSRICYLTTDSRWAGKVQDD